MYLRTWAGPQRLFDLKTDLLEMNNLVDNDDYQKVIQHLDQMLQTHIERTEDDWGIEAIFPPPNFRLMREGNEYFKELGQKAMVED